MPVLLNAQCLPLTTIYDEDNGQDGIMFDITASTDVTITGFDCNLDDISNLYDLEIYFKNGTHLGSTMTPGNWTLIGSTTGVVGLGQNIATPIPIVLNQALANGQTGAFYITASNGVNIAYTQQGVTPIGNIAAADANITVWDGTGKEYPFSTDYTARTPNITVHYDCCPPPDTVITPNSCSGLPDGTVEATGQGVGPWVYEISDISGVIETSAPTNGPILPISILGLCKGTTNRCTYRNTF